MQQYKNKITVSKSDAAHTSAAQSGIGKNASSLTDNRPASVIQRKPNNTGLPDQLKSGIENLSGYSLDDVKVHYNSAKPAQLNAHAYAQGTDIHVASGQEKHLPHEAWHVVQQKQGRVQATRQMKSNVNINDDKGLEKEADVMGQAALNTNKIASLRSKAIPAAKAAQRKIMVGTNAYSSIMGNMDELMQSLEIDPATEAELRKKGLSAAQVLARFDFRNRKFESKPDVILAIRKELKSDLGDDVHEKGSIDELVTTHALSRDKPIVKTAFLDFLKSKDPSGNLADLVLENTKAGKEAMDLFRSKASHPESDTILFKSILATIELFASGSTYHGEFNKKEYELLAHARLAYEDDVVKSMVQEYGLDTYEHNAVIAYSFPDKTHIFKSGKWNRHYMGYSKGNWGDYGDGWTALSSALKKLPSLGKLGLEVTAYRVSRNSEESDNLEKAAIGTPLLHGKHILGQEQQHYTSTGLTYSVHSNPQRIQTAKGLIAITGSSGVLINPFGGFGFLDGAEVLFPPHMVTRLAAKSKGAYKNKAFEVPVYHLHEYAPVKGDRDRAVDDFHFKKLASQFQETTERNDEKIKALIDQIQRFNQVLTGGGEAKITMQEKNVDALTRKKQELFDQIEANQDDPRLIENFEKLILIDKLNSLDNTKRAEIRISLLGQGLWQQSVQNLEKLAGKYKVL